MDLKRKKLLQYIENKKGVWADGTYKSAKYVLNALFEKGFPETPPREMYTALKASYKPYTVKQMFVRAKSLERQALGSTEYSSWMRDNQEAFRGAYARRENIPSDTAVQKLLELALSFEPDAYNGLVLMAFGGLRKSEAQAARWEDLDRVTGEVFVYQGKGRKNRTVYLSPQVVGRILPNNTPFVVPAGENLWRVARRLSKSIGETITPHSLRAYCLTRLSRRLSFPELMQYAGHSDYRTTMKYLVVQKETLMQKVSEVFNGPSF